MIKPCVCDPNPFQCGPGCVCAGCGCIKERPILFSAPMVLALLEDLKMQTRRILKQPKRKDGAQLVPELLQKIGVGAACPHGKPGDRLWVKETFLCDHFAAGDHKLTCSGCVRCKHTDEDRVQEWRDALFFRADGEPDFEGQPYNWKPSIFMPRWASRLTLEITGVRVERLQDITDADALAEGVDLKSEKWPDSPGTIPISLKPRFAYELLWESINGKGSWAANPWVWAITFKRVTP